MKISVLGDIIDTKKIYKISKLNENGMVIPYRCWFTIHFYNKKEIEISLSTSSVIARVIYNNSDEFNKAKSEVKEKVVSVRNKVLNYWVENKSDIPVIDFE